MSSLGPRLVLVTRETEYEGLVARHATRGQASVFLKRRAQSLDGLDRQRDTLGAMLATIRAGVPKGWRIAAVRRAELDRFLFAPEDVVVAVGQDGLVANLAKYLNGQPVIGVNADPGRNAGVLVPHAPEDVAGLLPLAATGKIRSEPRTMLRAELDDGQAILALNEVFIGHASHQSARYSLTWAGREELQSSSGLIVATGTGATGWALSISRATGITIPLNPDEPAGLFLVREPWPSPATGASIISGRLGPLDKLLLASRMNEGGVVFADGIEHDRLDFGWGRTLTVTVARQHLRFVPGRIPAARPTPATRPTAARPQLARRTAAAPAPPAPPKPVPPPASVVGALARLLSRRPVLCALVLVVAAAAIRSCDSDLSPATPAFVQPG